MVPVKSSSSSFPTDRKKKCFALTPPRSRACFFLQFQCRFFFSQTTRGTLTTEFFFDRGPLQSLRIVAIHARHNVQNKHTKEKRSSSILTLFPPFFFFSTPTTSNAVRGGTLTNRFFFFTLHRKIFRLREFILPSVHSRSLSLQILSHPLHNREPQQQQKSNANRD